MAYVLSLRPHSPLKRSFSDNPYLQTCSPLNDLTVGTLRDITPRNVSACSLYSLGSNQAGEWLRGTENTPPRLTSRSLLELVPEKVGCGGDAGAKDHVPRKRSCGLKRHPPSFSRTVTAPSAPYSKKARQSKPDTEALDNNLSSLEPMVLDSNTDEDTNYFDLYEAIHIPIPEGHWSDNTGSESHEERDEAPEVFAASPQPFRRWMSTLRRRHMHRHKDPISEVPALAIEISEDDVNLSTLHPPLVPLSETGRRFSDSMSSSLGCVTHVKSASITVASVSIAPRSDTGALHGRVRLGNRSSHYSEARKSTDSHRALGPILDESAWLRSVQRRKIVEELISSEESYIADLKVLINVRLPSKCYGIRSLIRLTGLFHDPNWHSCITSPNSSIHSTEHLSDPTAARRSAR